MPRTSVEEKGNSHFAIGASQTTRMISQSQALPSPSGRQSYQPNRRPNPMRPRQPRRSLADPVIGAYYGKMMHLRLCLLTCAIIASAIANGQSPLGMWIGHVDSSKVTRNHPKEDRLMRMMKDSYLSSRAVLKIWPDGSYSLLLTTKSRYVNAPTRQSETGPWNQAGRIITLTARLGSAKPLRLTINPNGRQMTCALPFGIYDPHDLSMIFKRSRHQ
jgi:hypothetical protein